MTNFKAQSRADQLRGDPDTAQKRSRFRGGSHQKKKSHFHERQIIVGRQFWELDPRSRIQGPGCWIQGKWCKFMTKVGKRRGREAHRIDKVVKT